jgi:hypothetical protein
MFAQKPIKSSCHFSMHPSGVTKENYESSVAGIQVDISSHELPHTKQENLSLNRDK